MNDHHHATSCACRIARNALRKSVRQLVLLTSSEDVTEVRKVLGSVLPDGSSCTGSVWRTPDGRTFSVKRYEDPVPAYRGSVGVVVCNGGRVLTTEETDHVKRWRKAATQPLSFVGPKGQPFPNPSPV